MSQLQDSMSSTIPSEKPANGLKGLRHWRADLLAGLQISFVALPLCLGIAVASGAPPAAGLIAGIIAGFIFPLIGGSYMTISGPAAGLAPIILSGILTLGAGNMALGYRLILVAIFFAGIVQLLLSIFRVGELVRIFPSAVLEGLLSAIGLTIITQQLPRLVGFTGPPHKEVPEALQALPEALRHHNKTILLLGVGFLVLMFVLDYLKKKQPFMARFLPASLIVVVLGIAAGMSLNLDPVYLAQLPDNFLHGLTLPPFGEIFSTPSLWLTFIGLVVALALVDSTESLTTASAVDRMDKYKRRSKPNRILLAMGVSNIASSLAGGLTIIPGGIKSRANIEAGGKTLWANWYTALFLLLFVLLAGSLIRNVTLCALAAILIFIGWKLCSPRIWQNMLRLGNDQFLIYMITFIAIIFTGLLEGILIGIAFYTLFLVYLLTPSIRYVLTGDISMSYVGKSLRKNMHHLFGNPIVKIVRRDHLVVINLKSLTNFNYYHLRRTLRDLPEHITVDLKFTKETKVVEHTAMAYVHYVQDLWGKQHHDEIVVEGLNGLHRFSSHPHAGGYNARLLEKEHFVLKHQEDEKILFD